jgi:hypothetical protein
MPCPAVSVVPLFALSMPVSLPWMLLWLPVVALPLIIARLAVRHARSVRWGAVDLVAAAARRMGLSGGVPWPLVVIRSAMLLLAVLAATRPFLSGSPTPAGPPAVPSVPSADGGPRIGAASRIAVVVAGRAAAPGASAAEDGSLPLRLAIAALGRTGGLSGGHVPAVDVVGTGVGLDVVLAAAETPDRAAESRRLVILCDGALPTAVDAARIAAAVEKGASLLVLVGRATLESADRPRVSDWLSSLAGVAVAQPIECGGSRIGVVPELAEGIDAPGPTVDPAEPFVALAGPVVDRCAELLVDPSASSGAVPPATVLARTLPDERPLLVESRVGDGRVWVSALPLSLPTARAADDFWSDLAAWPVFVPLVDRMLGRLLAGDGAAVAEARPRVETAGGRTVRPPFGGLPLAGTLLSLAILLAVLDPLVSLAFSGGSRGGGRARHARLLPARAAIIGSLVAMLLLWSGRPPAAAGRPPSAQRRVALLIDVSPSMATADAVVNAGDGSAEVERLAAVQRSLTAAGPSGGAVQRLCRERPVTVAAVGPAVVPLGDASPTTVAGLIDGLAALPPARSASRQGDAVAQAIATADDDLAAVVIASDGAIEGGLSWTRAAQVAIDRGVPIVAIPAGGGGAPAADDGDEAAVAFTAVRMPRVGWVGEEVAIGVRAERLVPGSQPIPFAVADREGRVVAEGLLRPDVAGDSREPAVAGLHGDLRWTPRETGLRTMLVRSGSGAATGVGDGVAVPCTIVDEPIRVLLVDAVPRFEHRFLEQSLARDPRFAVQACLLESATTPGMRATAAMPTTVAEWERFDVVVLGDVTPGDDGFSEAAARSLREAAAASGIGLAWSPGRRFRAAFPLAAGPAGEWLPAVPLEVSDRPAVAPLRLRIATAGWDDGWFLKSQSSTGPGGPDAFGWDDRRLFATLGPVRLRPTARILAVSEPCGDAADAARTTSGPAARSLPAIVLDRIGAATVLCHLCETWRWRDHGGTEAYGHYWRRSLMRLAEPRFLARLAPATIDVRPLQPREGDEPRIDVVATRPGADRAGWTLEHVGPDTPADAPLRIDLAAPARTLRTRRLEPGWHALRLRTPDGSTVVREFPVAARGLERPGARPRLAGMEAAAIASGGAVVPLDRIDSLPDTIAQLERRAEAGRTAARPAATRRPLDSPAAARWAANLLMIALVASCGVEWSLRVRGGLS